MALVAAALDEVDPRIALEAHAVCASTQDRACELAREGAPAGTLVVAQAQDAGYGRRGHTWSSPAGGVYFSLVAKPQVAMPFLGAVAPLATLAVVEELERWGVPAAIKWPNDVVAPLVSAEKRREVAAGASDDVAAGDTQENMCACGARIPAGAELGKLAGVIATAVSGPQGPVCVIGVGLNVFDAASLAALAALQPQNSQVASGESFDHVSEAGALPAAALYQVAPQAACFEGLNEGAFVGQDLPALENSQLAPNVTQLLLAMAQRLASAIVARLDGWEAAIKAKGAAAGPLGPVLEDYFDHLALLNQKVGIYPAQTPSTCAATGVLCGIDGWGRITVRTQDGRELEFAAEQASIRPVTLA